MVRSFVSSLMRDRALCFLIVTAVALLSFIAKYDYEWTVAIHQAASPGFAALMGRSLFEGQWPGVGDIGTILALGAIAAYVAAGVGIIRNEPLAEPWWRWQRAELGFIVFVILVVGIGLVHGSKFALGRPRPDAVEAARAAYAAFFEITPALALGRFSEGSFPSGHTATMMVLMAFVYVGWRDDLGGGFRRKLAGLIVLVGALLMGLARVMSFKHWVTDVVGAIFLAWIATHVAYHHLLKVQEQRAYMLKHGREAPLSCFWEAQLAGALLLALLGAGATVFFARLALARSAGLTHEEGLIWPIVFAVLATVLAALGLCLARKVRRRALNALTMDPFSLMPPAAHGEGKRSPEVSV